MASSDNTGEFKSYQPLVGRIKSKRWVQASNPSYDGGDWDDGYCYSDEEPVPEMPEMPEMPEIPVEDEALHHNTTDLQKVSSISSQKFVEAGVTKYALHEGATGEGTSVVGADEESTSTVTVVHDMGDKEEQLRQTAESSEVQQKELGDEEKFPEQGTILSQREQQIPPVIMVGPATPTPASAASTSDNSSVDKEATPTPLDAANEASRESRDTSDMQPSTGHIAGQSNVANLESREAMGKEAPTGGNLTINPVGPGQVENPQVSPGDGYPADIYGYYEDEGSKHDFEVEQVADERQMGTSGAGTTDDSGTELPDIPEHQTQVPGSHNSHSRSHSGHHQTLYPTDSVHSYEGDETDSTASLSTGRRSLDSSADQRSMRTSMDVPPQMRSKQGSLRQPVAEDDEGQVQTAVADNEAYLPQAAPSPIVSGGRWKPIASNMNTRSGDASMPVGVESSSTESPTTHQDKLTREILGSFSPPKANSPIGPKHAKQPSVEADEYSEPDPELAALYQNTSNFLSRPLSTYDYDNMAPIEPLSTNRSDQSAEGSEQGFASETEKGSVTAQSPDINRQHEFGAESPPLDNESSASELSSNSSSAPSPDPSRSLEAVSAAQVGTPTPKQESSLDQFSDFDSDFTTHDSAGGGETHSTGGTTGTLGAAAAAVTGAGVAAAMLPTVPEKAVVGSAPTAAVDSTLTERRSRQVSTATTAEPPNSGQISGTTASMVATSVGSKINRPPTFDFMGVLSKGRSEDRRIALEEARQKEFEYKFYRHGANLESWLEVVSSYHSGAGVYANGHPPPATQEDLKRAAPSRTMSSTFRPAKNVTKEAFGTLGEKSARKAKGLFSRGKSLLKS